MEFKSGRNKLFWSENGSGKRDTSLYEPCVSCINIKKISKIKKISQFGLEEDVREREKGGRKKASFFGDFTRFCRSELGKPRVKAALRDESYTWVPESQDFAKVQGSGFQGN